MRPEARRRLAPITRDAFADSPVSPGGGKTLLAVLTSRVSVGALMIGIAQREIHTSDVHIHGHKTKRHDPEYGQQSGATATTDGGRYYGDRRRRMAIRMRAAGRQNEGENQKGGQLF